MLNFSYDSFENVSVYFRSRIVELRLTHFLGTFQSFFAGIMFKCSRNKFWICFTFFQNKNAVLQLRKNLERSFSRSNNVEKQLGNFFCERTYEISKQYCWIADMTRFEKLLECCRRNIVEMRLRKFSSIVSEKIRSNNAELQLRQNFGNVSGETRSKIF